MKRKIYKHFAFAAIVAMLAVSSQIIKATIPPVTDPDCPNGCVAGSGGCHCHIDYPQYAEYIWPE